MYELHIDGDNFILHGTSESWHIEFTCRGLWKTYVRGTFYVSDSLTGMVTRILESEHVDPYANEFVELFDVVESVDAQNENLQ